MPDTVSDPAQTSLPAQGTTYTPDDLTKERFSNLAVVGKALMQTDNSNSFQTDFYIAKQALNRFVELYNRLQLDPETKAGMDHLISYLQVKIDRRLAASLKNTQV